jgi:hypothetical protein
MYRRFEKLLNAGRRLLSSEGRLDDIMINQGRILSQLNANKGSTCINDYEFKVFSQSGEDGIIQFLVANLRIGNRTFIEFGTEDFHESNCRFLMVKDGWSGFVIDGSPENMQRLRRSSFYWRYPLQCRAAFVTRENIRSILDESGFERNPGILSIDIDGVDFYVLKELKDWHPAVLIVEYNAVFGKARAVSVPYDPQFSRARKHFSNLYYGASLAAFVSLLGERDYVLVGTNSTGNNAFFVRRSLLNERVREVSLNDGFRESVFREGRDERNDLSYLAGNARRKVIEDMPLVDVLSGENLQVKDLTD